VESFMSNDNHMKEPTSEKEDVSPLGYIAKASENVFSVMKLLLGVSVMIGVIYNFGYFYNLGIAYTIFLDYTDFLYTPLFIIGKIISLSLIIVTIRLTWMSWPKAAAIDRAFTVVIFILH
jgi:lipoprotein signal peptidase